MSLIVVDASTVGAWLLPSQASAASDQLLRDWGSHQGITPALYALEVRALLLKAERRGWLPGQRWDQALDQLDSFGIVIEASPSVAALDEIMELARRTGLTLYDALYLDLAVQAGAELATRDSALHQAARALTIAVHDLRL